MVITRFAPSPTGDPHIGNIRSALFAYLFAKSQGGKFLLRIEDTDRKRHDAKSVETIKEALRWLSLEPENIDNPMIQSKRLRIYREAALKLVEEGKAYVCTCTPEELKASHDQMVKEGKPPMYDGKCRNSKHEIRNAQLPEGAVIRMKVPTGAKIAFNDLVRGKVEFNTDTIDDQVILKSDGYPTYHLAHVVDDHEMQVTHVIRAEEWLSSTPKHIILNQMLGYPIPQYAHLPIILSPSRAKLSKRDGAVGILEYKKLGYLPEALLNFMAFLGWNPKDEREFFSLAELEKEFNLKNVNKAAAVFDIKKLNFINHHYLREKPTGELVELIGAEARKKYSAFAFDRVVELAKERMEKISDFDRTVSYLLSAKPPAQSLIFKKSDREKTVQGLKASQDILSKLDDFSEENIKNALEKCVSATKLSNGDVFWPVRVALSGMEKSPPPVQIAEVLGKNKTLKRLQTALDILGE